MRKAAFELARVSRFFAGFLTAPARAYTRAHKISSRAADGNSANARCGKNAFADTHASVNLKNYSEIRRAGKAPQRGGCRPYVRSSASRGNCSLNVFAFMLNAATSTPSSGSLIQKKTYDCSGPNG